MNKQKIELVKPYVAYGPPNDRFFAIKNVPSEVVKQLFGKWPNADPKDRQNGSPTLQKMVDLVSKYQGTLEGYVIPVETGRDDARVGFDGFTLNIDKKEARRIRRNLKPDAFDEKDKDTFRFWWD